MVSIKHKVTIKTKTAPEGTPPTVESPVGSLTGRQPEVAPEANKSNTGKIVAAIIAVVAIFAGIYFFGIKGGDNAADNGNASTEQFAQAGELAQTETQPDNLDKAAQGNEAEIQDNSGTIAPADAHKMPASDENANVSAAGNVEENLDEAPSINERVAQKPAMSVEPRPNVDTVVKKSTTTAPISGDVVENAKRVIRGDFGNGQKRKDNLGSAYTEIQSKVNEMYRQGLVR